MRRGEVGKAMENEEEIRGVEVEKIKGKEVEEVRGN